MREALEGRGVNPSEKVRSLIERLRDRKAPELALFAQKAGSDLDVVVQIAERFKRAAENPEDFLKQVGRKALDALENGKLEAEDLVQWLFFGKGPPDEKGKRPVMTMQLALDVDDPERFNHKLYSSRTRSLVIKHLPDRPEMPSLAAEDSQDTHEGQDGLTGEEGELECDTFTKVDLPIVPQPKVERQIGRKRFPLLSMFSEARCNQRYRMTDAMVFPMKRGRDVRLREALEFITADERRGKTWQLVASGRFETNNRRKREKLDLLIAYVEEQPDLDAAVVAFFGGGPEVSREQFMVDASALCKALEGIARERPKSRLNLFLIREASKGQIHVALAASLTVEQVMISAERWQEAVTGNLPSVRIPLFVGQEGKGTILGRPVPPYPDQVVDLLSRQWVRGGSQRRSTRGRAQKPNYQVPGPELGEVLALMLRSEGRWERAAQALLSLSVQRLTPLLLGLGGAPYALGLRKSNKAREPLDDYKDPSREIALRSVAFLGILLDALGARKDVYMKESAFLVGQALALADTLHKDYCTVVRKGAMPNQLIGTGLMRRALDNPAGALADLAERILEYLRWAKTAEERMDWPEGDPKRIAVREARKKLRQYQYIAENLATRDLPTQCDDVMKA